MFGPRAIGINCDRDVEVLGICFKKLAIEIFLYWDSALLFYVIVFPNFLIEKGNVWLIEGDLISGGT